MDEYVDTHSIAYFLDILSDLEYDMEYRPWVGQLDQYNYYTALITAQERENTAQ